MRRTYPRIVAAAAALLIATSVFADVRLPRILGSNMVLQCDKPLPVWGRAEAGEKVTVTLGNQTKAATAGQDGKWKVTLDKLQASNKPVKMVVKGKNTITLENVLVGEVWLGSGQSNMAWGVGGAAGGKQEIAAANYPKIRLFQVRNRATLKPQGDLGGQWLACSPKTIGRFSAAAYYFGRKVHKELKVPVGLIASSWGGTRIEPWTPLVGLESQPQLKAVVQRAKKPGRVGPRQIHQFPTALYNAMIHPLAPFTVRGVIWYQGESNAMSRDGMGYFVKKKALIGGWRKVWGQGDFPFLFVQLAPWNRYPPGALPRFWEAQTACLSIPNTGMVVTTDITGNVGNIHPPNKQDVGKRLGLWALAKTYGRDKLIYSGPMYKSMEVKGGKVYLSFDHVGGGLVSRDGKPLSWFTVAGEDRKFVQATAKIEGDKVAVSSDAVARPVAVRFGWHKTAVPNLSNKEGLPAGPFRTDKWAPSTKPARRPRTGRSKADTKPASRP